jgi:hypothetical protein
MGSSQILGQQNFSLIFTSLLHKPTQNFLSCWATRKLFYDIGQQNFLTSASFIKTKHPTKGEKGRAKKENPKSKPKAQKPKVGRKG